MRRLGSKVGKHLFVGEERIMAKWVGEFPDLINFVSGFTSASRLDDGSFDALRSLQNSVGFNSDLIVATQKDTTRELGDLLAGSLGSGRLIHIREFVHQKLAASELMPGKLRVDASTICQLKCRSCYMRLFDNGSVGRGYLTFENFRDLLERSPFINEVELSNSGEIFLNPDLVLIMKYAYENGVRLTALNGVNFNRVSEEQLEGLVKYHFGSVMVSIDGASETTYSQYRVKGNFGAVIDNIKRLIDYKKSYHSQEPLIVWQYIIMEHNESDVPLAKIQAKELGIPIWFKLTWDSDYIPVDRDMLERETGLTALTRAEYLATTGKVYLGSAACRQMFTSPQLNWDGRLLGCCEVFSTDYGIDVFDVGLREALQNAAFVEAKRVLLGETLPDQLSVQVPCLKCEKWLQMSEVGEVVSPLEEL